MAKRPVSPPPSLAPTGLWGPRRCRAPHAPLPHRCLLAGWQWWWGGDPAQLLLAGDVTGCYSPYYPPPPRHAVWECFSWELLNNLHPPRRSFWAVFVKVNLQLAASGDSNMIAASSLNDTHTVIAPALTPPALAQTRAAGPERHRRAGLVPGIFCPFQYSPRHPQPRGCNFLGPGKERATSSWVPQGRGFHGPPPTLLRGEGHHWGEPRCSMRNARETRHFFQAASAGASPPSPASPFARLPVVHVTSWGCSAPADPAIDLCWLGDRLCPPHKGSCQGTGDSAGRGTGTLRHGRRTGLVTALPGTVAQG